MVRRGKSLCMLFRLSNRSQDVFGSAVVRISFFKIGVIEKHALVGMRYFSSSKYLRCRAAIRNPSTVLVSPGVV